MTLTPKDIIFVGLLTFLIMTFEKKDIKKHIITILTVGPLVALWVLYG